LRVYLVRHGEIPVEFEGRYNGWIDVPLDTDRFLPDGVFDSVSRVEFDGIYSSDLSRCVQTARAVGFSPILDERLREKSFGRGEGMSYDEICDKFGILYDDFESFIERIGGETITEFKYRIDDFLSQAKAMHGKKSILVFTHSGVIRYILSKVQKISLEEAFCIKIPYGGVTVVTL